jgi:hypothetical protein
MGRQLLTDDRKTLASGTLAVLTNVFQLSDKMADWREGDVCMFERNKLLYRTTYTGWRNLRTGQITDWPAMGRFRLLEDPADD